MTVCARSVSDIEIDVTNQNLEGHFYFGTGPAYDLYWDLLVKNDSGKMVEAITVKVDDVLTAGERTSLNSLLVKLRDGALTAKGYVDQT
jgi:hypothetical protein